MIASVCTWGHKWSTRSKFANFSSDRRSVKIKISFCWIVEQHFNNQIPQYLVVLPFLPSFISLYNLPPIFVWHHYILYWNWELLLAGHSSYVVICLKENIKSANLVLECFRTSALPICWLKRYFCLIFLFEKIVFKCIRWEWDVWCTTFVKTGNISTWFVGFLTRKRATDWIALRGSFYWSVWYH